MATKKRNSFVTAIETMWANEEFDKTLACTPLVRVGKVKRDIKAIEKYMDNGKLYEGSIVPLLMELHSEDVMRDIILHMMH